MALNRIRILSAFKCPVQVEAVDEAQARHAAADQLCPDYLFNPGIIGLNRPWSRVDRVRCIRIEAPDTAIPLLQCSIQKSGRAGRPNKQSLFLLTPLRLHAPEWKLSTSTSRVCVSALTSCHARVMAAIHYDINATHETAKPPVTNPWWNPGLVSATAVPVVPEGCPVLNPKEKPARFGVHCASADRTGFSRFSPGTPSLRIDS